MANKVHQAIAKNIIEAVRPLRILTRPQKIDIYYAAIKGMATDSTFADQDLSGYDVVFDDAIKLHKRCTK